MNFSTCDLCDEHHGEVALGRFRVLPPVFRHLGGRRAFSGQVVTVRCFEDNSFVASTLRSEGLGRVLVVAGGASLRHALVGGNLAAEAVRHGWAGILVDGCVRDVSELAAAEVGLCALGTIPLPTEKRQTGSVDVPVCVQGVWIAPGEWLYADEDGIVVADRALS